MPEMAGLGIERRSDDGTKQRRKPNTQAVPITRAISNTLCPATFCGCWLRAVHVRAGGRAAARNETATYSFSLCEMPMGWASQFNVLARYSMRSYDVRHISKAET